MWKDRPFDKAGKGGQALDCEKFSLCCNSCLQSWVWMSKLCSRRPKAPKVFAKAEALLGDNRHLLQWWPCLLKPPEIPHENIQSSPHWVTLCGFLPLCLKSLWLMTGWGRFHKYTQESHKPQEANLSQRHHIREANDTVVKTRLKDQLINSTI